MNSTANSSHIPVLLPRALDFLSLDRSMVVIDATFGGGGYSKAILERGVGKLIAFDRDPDAIARSENLRTAYGARFVAHHACFGEMAKFVEPGSIDAIVFDFGVSSFQLDTPRRGFSFRLNAPLDMRMGVGSKHDARHVVNTFSEKDLADIIYFYGDEKKARPIARAIVERRLSKPFETTFELADVIRTIVKRRDGIDPATLTFQALRIFVNDELAETETALRAVDISLKPNGRLVTVTFHSLEDRTVKNHCGKAFVANSVEFVYGKLTPKVIVPTREDIIFNPRARSAKLRAYVKRARG